jgi:hypothetical protein
MVLGCALLHPTYGDSISLDGKDWETSLANFFGHDRIAINSVRGHNILPDAFTQIGIGEVNVAHVGIDNFSSLHGDITQAGFVQQSVSDKDVIQVAANQNSSFEVGLGNSGTLKIAPAHIRLFQQALIEVGIDQNRVAQITNSKDRVTQMSIGQIGTSQVRSSEIDTLKIAVNNTDSGQVSILQLASSQTSSIQNQIAQVNSIEVALPSSITLQQFLSSHNFNLQNTTIPTWTEFLTGTTPFNLKCIFWDTLTLWPKFSRRELRLND